MYQEAAVGGRVITALEWGAGDTSVGMLFHGTTTTPAGVIDDQLIDGGTLFGPGPN